MTLSTDYWKAQAAACQEALLTDLAPLIAIESVRDDSLAAPGAPFGPGPAAALDYMLGLAARDGFDAENIDGYAGVIRFGQGDKVLGLLVHLDVVPATGKWLSPPFTATIRDGALYGRGTSDDKGPALACYYALKLLRDAGVTPNCQIHFILGTDEENRWQCMEHYFASQPMPDLAFSPDADFPIVNGEKGLLDLPVRFAIGTSAGATGQLLRFDGGIRTNIVPETAECLLRCAQPDFLVLDYMDFLAGCDLTGSTERDGDTLRLICHGRSAHAMEPEVGANAATGLAAFLSSYDFGDANAFLQFLGQTLHEDFTGQRLGIACHDAVMGDVSVNPGLIHCADGEAEIVLNIRHPRGTTAEAIVSTLRQRFGDSIGEPRSVKDVHYVADDDPLVTTLLDIYRAHTGNPATPRAIGGITYAHVIPRGVAYGMTMPDSDIVIHQPNESCRLADLQAATAIYADAIYQLSQ